MSRAGFGGLFAVHRVRPSVGVAVSRNRDDVPAAGDEGTWLAGQFAVTSR